MALSKADSEQFETFLGGSFGQDPMLESAIDEVHAELENLRYWAAYHSEPEVEQTLAALRQVLAEPALVDDAARWKYVHSLELREMGLLPWLGITRDRLEQALADKRAGRL